MILLKMVGLVRAHTPILVYMYVKIINVRNSHFIICFYLHATNGFSGTNIIFVALMQTLFSFQRQRGRVQRFNVWSSVCMGTNRTKTDVTLVIVIQNVSLCFNGDNLIVTNKAQLMQSTMESIMWLYLVRHTSQWNHMNYSTWLNCYFKSTGNVIGNWTDHVTNMEQYQSM